MGAGGVYAAPTYKWEVKMAERMITRVLDIEGMMTEGEADAVKRALEAFPGVQGVEVDLEHNQATVVAGNDVADLTLMEAVATAGADPLSCWISKVVKMPAA